ncbi:hypothetical protein [Nocardia sp. NPDC050406]|uniref:hypothetical protein n=1 Tax=Nocardia sp. NPDC050406 TaxID=3364318 RepID=UPI00379E5EA4
MADITTDERLRAALAALARTDFGALRHDNAEVTRVEVPVHPGPVAPEEFREYLALTVREWGPVSLYGGADGVFALWQGDSVFRLLKLDARAAVTALATDPRACQEWFARVCEPGDLTVANAPYSWLGGTSAVREEFPGSWFTAFARTWEEMTEGLAATLRDVYLGMRYLGVGAPGPLDDEPDTVRISLAPYGCTHWEDPRIVQLEQRIAETRVYVDGSTVDRTWLTARGFVPMVGGQWRWVRPLPPDRSEFAAELAVELLREFGFRQPLDTCFRSGRASSPYESFSLHAIGADLEYLESFTYQEDEDE